jgi:hypothetical protein
MVIRKELFLFLASKWQILNYLFAADIPQLPALQGLLFLVMSMCEIPSLTSSA